MIIPMKIRIWFSDKYEDFNIWRAQKRQIQKFEDPRRVEIYSSVELSNEQKAAIDKLYLDNYGKKIPYTWHRHFTAYTGKFDVNYFPEMLYIPEFERFQNVNYEYCSVLADKNMLPLIAASVNDGVKVAKIFLSCSNGMYRDQKFSAVDKDRAIEILSDIGKVFAKPSANTSSGRNCMILEMQNGIDQISGKTVEEILISFGNDFTIQQLIRCHKSITDIYSKSVNTFRIITYRWKDKIEHMPIIMRIGQGGAYVDNAHAGGMFIAVDDDGTLHEKAFTEFRKEFNRHPDTGLVFKGHKIANIPEVIGTALKMHEAVPQIGCVNWDFTVDEDGNPLLVEANTKRGSIWLMEMAHGRGVFGDKTKEVLQWLRAIKSVPKSKRSKYYFGYMGD